ncbi:MAG: EthD domain-containing protein [Casimicrobiaceae bacterium]
MQPVLGGQMIKRVTIMTRKPGMTREDFADYWIKRHAPLLASHPSVKRFTINVTHEYLRFGVRNEDLEDPLRTTILTKTPDGIVELWFEDRESMEAMYKSEFTAQLVADAGNFVGAIVTFIMDEHEIKSDAA